MKKRIKSLIKTLLGVPQRVQILGFYKGIPMLHDPKYPAPDGVIYFINNENYLTPYNQKGGEE